MFHMNNSWAWWHSNKWTLFGFFGNALSHGGASKASVATLTDYVAGAGDIYVRQALWLIAHRACANVAESAIFEIHFYRERNLWKKKISCSGVDSNLSSGVDSNPGLMHCRPLPLPPSQWGSGSSRLQIWLLYCWVLTTVRVHSHQGYLEKANRLRHYKVYLLYSSS